MSYIMPHFAKALDLSQRAQLLAEQHQGLLAAMDRLTVGVCLLDQHGCIVHCNDEFGRQQEAYNVFSVTYSGQLEMQHEAEQMRFAKLKTDASNLGARPRKEAVSVRDDVFLFIEVAPLGKPAGMGTHAFNGCILYSTDTSLPVHCDTEPLQKIFGLTEAELALVDAITDGATNSQIAKKRNRSVATINSQVKSILAKTRCSNRTQLVRLLMSFGTNYLDANIPNEVEPQRRVAS